MSLIYPLPDVIDLGGTVVFALSGAMAGIRSRLDLFGILVVSFAAGIFGGLTRDVLIGDVPPAAIHDWRYITACSAAGVVAFFWPPVVSRLRQTILFLDAVGLSLFAVAGATKALTHGIPPIGAILLGMLSGIGGGMLRDILVNRVPLVLQAEIYAVAALGGAVVVVVGPLLGISPTVAAILGAVLCFWLRMMGILRGWGLPRAR